MFERCLYFNINALSRKLNAVWEKAFAQFELPPSHAYLLRLVLETPGLTQQDLAKELQLNKSTINRFVSALEKKQLLNRQGTALNQKEKTITPTKKALEIHRRLENQGSELYASMCSTIGREKVESFVKAARSINASLKIK